MTTRNYCWSLLIAIAFSPFAYAGPESAFEAWDSGPLDKKLQEEFAPKQAAPWLPSVEELGEQSPLQQPGAGSDVGANPLGAIGQRMQTARKLISERDLSGQVTTVQKEIVSELDKLIEEAEKQCKNCSSGNCNKPGQKPGQQASQRSQPKPGGASKPSTAKTSSAATAAKTSSPKARQNSSSKADPVTDAQLMREVWGNLPQRMREQMLQSAPDDFLPKYRTEIERYYQKLAEEEQGE